MVKKVIHHIKEGTTYAGLEISNSSTGNTYHFLEIKKVKSQLVISKSLVLKKLEELLPIIKRTTPLFLCVNNESVVTKELSQCNTTSEMAIVNEAFPNLDHQNFYWELVQKTSNTIVSIVRKESIEGLCDELKQLKLVPFQLCLGISSLKTLLPFIKEEYISLPKQQGKLESNKLMELKFIFNSEKKFYYLNGLKISNTNILSFGQILGYLNKVEKFTNFEERNITFSKHLKNERIFQNTGKISLLFFTVMLLVNFLIYNHYLTQVNNLSSVLAESSDQRKNLLVLENTVKKKQERVETISKTSNSKTTYLLDVLAQSIPKSILLNGIEYQPLLKNIQEEKPVLLEKEIILISGVSNDIDEFSNWIESLEKFTWIKSIETLDYDFIVKNTSGFLIEIKANDQY